MQKIIAFFMSILMSIFSFLGVNMDKLYEKRKLDPEKLLAAMDARVGQDLAEEKLTGIEVLVKCSGETVLRKTYGKKNAGGEAMPEDAVYRIASMTKPITAAALVLEAERGHVDLNADVSVYLDGFKDMSVGEWKDGKITVTGKAKNSMKVYQLVSHSSGLASGEMESQYLADMQAADPDFTITELTEYLSRMPLLYDPGTAQAYSTVAFDVAARIVELTSGMSFAEYVKVNIFDKLGMTDTTFSPSAEQWDRVVGMHARTEDGKAYDLPMTPGSVFGSFPPSFIIAGGGLVSTASDYSKFAEMLLNKGKAADGTQVLSEESVEKMSSPWGSDKNMGDARWGLGVIVYINDNGRLPKGSFGWSGAYGTHFFIDPADHLTAVYMKNSSYEGGAGCRTANNFEEDIMDSFVWKLGR